MNGESSWGGLEDEGKRGPDCDWWWTLFSSRGDPTSEGLTCERRGDRAVDSNGAGGRVKVVPVTGSRIVCPVFLEWCLLLCRCERFEGTNKSRSEDSELCKVIVVKSPLTLPKLPPLIWKSDAPSNEIKVDIAREPPTTLESRGAFKFLGPSNRNCGPNYSATLSNSSSTAT